MAMVDVDDSCQFSADSQWLHLTGEVDKCVRSSCQTISRFNIPKTIKLGAFLTGKGKAFPYSLPSVVPGADAGVQAVSPP